MSVLLLTLIKAVVSVQATQGEVPAVHRPMAELRTMAVKHFAGD